VIQVLADGPTNEAGVVIQALTDGPTTRLAS
jgi:hypothetical protein